MAQGFLALVGGKVKQIFATVTSAGAANADNVVALDSAGKLDMSVMPVGIGANTQVITASEALTAGSFVQIYTNAGAAGVRLADASNGREANGFVLAAVASAAAATVYPLDSVNNSLTGLTPGATYWLGNAGAATATPLDATDTGNVNKVNQILGKAKSATELVTDDYGYQVL
ncbi:hypothetical protein [Diaphorobacter caeni]|uniref:hypothetical protein n=1 Tax=Diaphorobacter caeni TaxID=2784387 RepID=UPI00188FEF26|nr:hypothetical protein [Diaphorobacter caeni]MBF5006835.1 hypothetical protein [Diaphorobacter caeni]